MSFTPDDLDQIHEAMRRNGDADEAGELGNKVDAWCAARLTPEELEVLYQAVDCLEGEVYGTKWEARSFIARNIMEKLAAGLNE